MKKTIALVLALVMIMSLATVYADAFTPPGQAKKNMAGQLIQKQTEWNKLEMEDGWSPLALPFGLIGKGVPPGLAKKGGLPPGLAGRAFDQLPPGIQMRFMHSMPEGVPEEDPTFEAAMVVDNLDDLMDAIENDDIKLILLTETILVDVDTLIEGDFKTIRSLSAADIDKMEEEEIDVENLTPFNDAWLIEVENEALLTLHNIKLVGDGKEGDAGLVKVEAGAELSTLKVWFSKAHTAVKIYVDENVDDLTTSELAELVEAVEVMATELTEESQNIFDNVATRVHVVDENGVDILEFVEDEE